MVSQKQFLIAPHRIRNYCSGFTIEGEVFLRITWSTSSVAVVRPRVWPPDPVPFLSGSWRKGEGCAVGAGEVMMIPDFVGYWKLVESVDYQDEGGGKPALEWPP